MHCINCGALLEIDANFCQDCGAAVVTARGNDDRLHKGMVIAGSLMAVEAVLGLAARFVVLQGNSPYQHYKLVYFLIGLLSVASPFVLAYYSTIRKYSTMLIIVGIVLAVIHLFYFLDKF